MTEKNLSEAAQSKRGWSLLEVLAALLIISFGVALFVKLQGNTRKQSTTNTRILKAGHKIERYLEDMRIAIAQNPTTNWPANGIVTIAADADSITLIREVSDAASPKDGEVVANVKKLDITTFWGTGGLDTLRITTYVSKKF